VSDFTLRLKRVLILISFISQPPSAGGISLLIIRWLFQLRCHIRLMSIEEFEDGEKQI
jgi:hypothetical protein